MTSRPTTEPAPPVFLVSARRSGTTLLRLMLDGHPEIGFVNRWEEVADAIASPPSGQARRYDFKGIGTVEADSAESLRDALRTRVDERLSTGPERLFGATCHVGFLQLAKVWPEARYIHLVRDPRDVALSFLSLGWSGHPFFAADAWRQAEEDWERLCPTLDADRRFELRYEDLVKDPRDELARLCDFLGVPYSEALFSYTETSPYSFPKVALSGRWRGKIPTEELPLFERSAGTLMGTRGYPAEGTPRDPGRFEVGLFRIRDYVARKRFQLKQEGLGQLLGSKLARLSRSRRLIERQAAAREARRKKRIAALERNY